MRRVSRWFGAGKAKHSVCGERCVTGTGCGPGAGRLGRRGAWTDGRDDGGDREEELPASGWRNEERESDWVSHLEDSGLVPKWRQPPAHVLSLTRDNYWTRTSSDARALGME